MWDFAARMENIAILSPGISSMILVVSGQRSQFRSILLPKPKRKKLFQAFPCAMELCSGDMSCKYGICSLSLSKTSTSLRIARQFDSTLFTHGNDFVSKNVRSPQGQSEIFDSIHDANLSAFICRYLPWRRSLAWAFLRRAGFG